jgi:mpaB/rubber oxygenase-like protein
MIVFPVLTAHERERLYDESKVLARLFGIPEDQLPQTLPTIWRPCMPQTYSPSAQTRVSWPTGFSPAPLLGCARRDGIARLPHDSCRNACVKRSDLNTVVQSNVLPTRRYLDPLGLSCTPQQIALRWPLPGGRGAIVGGKATQSITRVANWSQSVSRGWIAPGADVPAHSIARGLQQELEAQCGPIALMTQTN